MSDYQSNSGKIKLVEPKEGESFEQQCQRLWFENGMKEEDYSEGELFEEFHKKYIEVKDTVWEILEEKNEEEEDMFCTLHKNVDGTYSFYTRFYNGGTCMSEMIQDAIKQKMKKNEI